jgi:hypothetical protein
MTIEEIKVRAHNDHASIMEGLSRPQNQAKPSVDASSGSAEDGNRRDKPGLIIKVANSLRQGVLADGLDPSDPAVQNLARLFWCEEPPTLWVLAQSHAQGEAFPFRAALDAYLANEKDRASAALLNSRLVKSLAAAQTTLHAAADSLRAYREKFLAWEQQTQRAWMPLPATAQLGAPEGAELDAGATTQFLADGLELTLAAETDLVVIGLKPTPAKAPEHVLLLGSTETADTTPLHMQWESYGEYASAKINLGNLQDRKSQLGPECVLLVSNQPVPELPR